MKNKKSQVVFGIVVFILYSIFFVLSHRYSDKKTEEFFDFISKNYPTLRVWDSLDNRIVDVYEPKGLPLTGGDLVMYLEFDNHKKHKVAVIKKLSGVYLSEVAKIGAKVIKPAGSDTVTVIYGGKEYRFILCKDAL